MEIFTFFIDMQRVCEGAEEVRFGTLFTPEGDFITGKAASEPPRLEGIVLPIGGKKISLAAPVICKSAYTGGGTLSEIVGLDSEVINDIVCTRKCLSVSEGDVSVLPLSELGDGCACGARAVEMLLDKHANRLNGRGLTKAHFLAREIPVIPEVVRLAEAHDGAFAESAVCVATYRLWRRNERVKHFFSLGAPTLIMANEERMLREAAEALFAEYSRLKITFE